MDFEGFERDFSADTSEQPFHRLLRRARRATARQDYETARRILEAIARAVPDSTSVLYPLACTLYRMGAYCEAFQLSARLNRLGDTRGRTLCERLESIRETDPVAWNQSVARKSVSHPSIRTSSNYQGARSLMMDVRLSGHPEDTLALMRVARLHEINYRFTDEVAPGVVPIQIIDTPDRVLAETHRERGVRISTCQREGICAYTGLDQGAYLLLCALLGTTQWRTLALNPLLIPEDFHHGPVCGCLFSHQVCRQDFALVLEEPEVCPNCVAFYRCLGAERDVETLLGFLNSFRTALSPYDSTFSA